MRRCSGPDILRRRVAAGRFTGGLQNRSHVFGPSGCICGETDNLETFQPNRSAAHRFDAQNLRDEGDHPVVEKQGVLSGQGGVPERGGAVAGFQPEQDGGSRRVGFRRRFC